MSGDVSVVGRAPGVDGAEGGEHCVEGVAAAVAHDAPAVGVGERDVAGEAVEDEAPCAAALRRERAALRLLVVLVRQPQPLEGRGRAGFDEDAARVFFESFKLSARP